MSTERIYLSTTIPYVNGRPHLGHALEFVQADVLARYHRQQGREVRLQTGTDDNSLKNVLAAAAEGVPTGELVERNSAAFAALGGSLSLSFDDFIRTSSDPRHRAGVERFWQACAASGDLYRKHYQGLYCVGCEQFYKPAELPGGRCPEHGTEPQAVAEENWFFRLSRYTGALQDLITSGRLRIEPAARRNEVLGLIAGGLEDFSVSRSVARARGWGIPVPGDPGQVIYVWWDALGNYITSLGYGGGDSAPDFQRWWVHSGRRVHLAGKGVVRFHAVYWPAMLLSAGLPLPTDVLVHDYLTVDGAKISKSAGPEAARHADPAVLAGRFGADAVRWWLLREVPRTGDADFTDARLIARANEDLANGLGNLVSRVTSMVHRYRGGQVPVPGQVPAPGQLQDPGQLPGAGQSGAGQSGAGQSGAGQSGPGLSGPGLSGAGDLAAAADRAAGAIAAALSEPDFRAATAAVTGLVDEANRYVTVAAPWRLAAAERGGDPAAGQQLDVVLATLIDTCQALARLLIPFLPDLSARIAAACGDGGSQLPAPQPLYPRIGELTTAR